MLGCTQRRQDKRCTRTLPSPPHDARQVDAAATIPGQRRRCNISKRYFPAVIAPFTRQAGSTNW